MTRHGGSDHQDARLARVRKLLAKAENPAVTAAEAATYNAKAAELIAAYGIDAALLAAAEPGGDTVADTVIVLDPPYARDKADLLLSVAQVLRCRTVLRTRWAAGAREFSLHLFGFGSDLVRVELLFTSLLVQAAHGLAAAPVPAGEHTAAFRRSWLAGFTHAVARRLSEAERRARDEADRRASRPRAGSTALVLADRSAQVERARDGHYPALDTARRRTLSGGGSADGYLAGTRADLGATRIGEREAGAPALAPGRRDEFL